MTKKVSEETVDSLKIAAMEVGKSIIDEAYAELIKEHELTPNNRDKNIFLAGIVTGAHSALAAMIEAD